MINLLPLEIKKELYWEQMKNTVAILACLAVFFAICLILILYSVKFYVLNQVVAYGAASPSEFVLNDFRGRSSIELEMEKYNKIMPQIADFYANSQSFSLALEKMMSAGAKDIIFSDISISSQNQSGLKMSVFGRAKSRLALEGFRSALEGDRFFEGVYFSPESWIKETDPNFSLSITFNGNKK